MQQTGQLFIGDSTSDMAFVHVICCLHSLDITCCSSSHTKILKQQDAVTVQKGCKRCTVPGKYQAHLRQVTILSCTCKLQDVMPSKQLAPDVICSYARHGNPKDTAGLQQGPNTSYKVCVLFVSP